jgi:hypothetical protein
MDGEAIDEWEKGQPELLAMNGLTIDEWENGQRALPTFILV